jgi:hypothetical protein
MCFSVAHPQEVTGMPQPGYNGLKDPIPLALRKSIAVYEAGKAMLAYITPEYDEIARVSVCPYNMVTGAARTQDGRLRWLLLQLQRHVTRVTH